METANATIPSSRKAAASTTTVVVNEPKPRKATNKFATVSELITVKCAATVKGFLRSLHRKHPICYVTYVPHKGKFKGERRDFAMMACGVYPAGRSAILKPLDENGEILHKYPIKVREWVAENFATMQFK